jgi:hypothetical protein
MEHAARPDGTYRQSITINTDISEIIAKGRSRG